MRLEDLTRKNNQWTGQKQDVRQQKVRIDVESNTHFTYPNTETTLRQHTTFSDL